MNLFKGYIPEKITYVHSKKSETIEERFEDSNECFVKTKIYPTFPVESGKSTDTAKSWAAGYNKEDVKETEIENTGTRSVRVVGLEHRGNGGRAYKVIVDGKYYVDLREDVILETMITTGIESGGLLNGEFVWAKYGGHLKLIRKGTALHETYVESTKNRETFKDLTAADITPGGVFLMKSGTKMLYLGRFKHFKHEYDHDHGGYFGKPSWTNKRLVPSTSHVFVELPSYEKISKKMTLDEIFKKVSGRSFEVHYIRFYKTKSKFVRKEYDVDFSGYDIPVMIRELAEKHNRLKDNPYPHNYPHEHLSISSGDPIVNPIIEKFNLPIKTK